MKKRNSVCLSRITFSLLMISIIFLLGVNFLFIHSIDHYTEKAGRLTTSLDSARIYNQSLSDENDSMYQELSQMGIELGRYEIIMSLLEEKYPNVYNDVTKNLE